MAKSAVTNSVAVCMIEDGVDEILTRDGCVVPTPITRTSKDPCYLQ